MSNKNWSREQLCIFNWFKTGRGNLVVRARAGTGKTTTILEGVNRAPERSILLAAFNKSIANELQQRVNNPRVEAKTLHGLGFKFIRRNWNDVKVDDNNERARDLARQAAPDAPDPVINLIRQLHTRARECDPFILRHVARCEHSKQSGSLDSACWRRPREEGPRFCEERIQRAVNTMQFMAVSFNLIPDEEWSEQGWDTDDICEAALVAMEIAKVRTPFIDFADMIYLPLVHNWVRPWFEMVVIDEAQDMTIAQLTLATGACKRNGRIAVVGDDRQAIYGFRGADSGSLDRLKDELQAEEMSLTTTYRCPKLIVALAQKLVPDINAAPTAIDGSILQANIDKMIETATEGDFILSRKNAPLAKVCLALLKRGVRARIKGRDIGAGILALIRKMKAKDINELLGALRAWRDLECERARKKLVGDAADARIGFVTDQYDLLVEMTDGVTTIPELRTRLETLFSDDAEKQAVMCSTVHKAKGLETDRTWLLTGTFRHGALEEENIQYVAITRAKQTLTWVSGFEQERK